MDNGEYILGILVIIAIYIYYIGDVVWGFNISDRLCKKEKETEHKINARRNLTWSCYKVLNLLIISMWQSYMIIYAKGEYRG